RPYAHARLARMYCGDADTVSADIVQSLAEGIHEQQVTAIRTAVGAASFRLSDLTVDPSYVPKDPELRKRVESAPEPVRQQFIRHAMAIEGATISPAYVVAGSGEFLARRAVERSAASDAISLTERLGPAVSACAPAYAVAVLATERGLP